MQKRNNSLLSLKICNYKYEDYNLCFYLKDKSIQTDITTINHKNAYDRRIKLNMFISSIIVLLLTCGKYHILNGIPKLAKQRMYGGKRCVSTKHCSWRLENYIAHKFMLGTLL